jgi:tetratricopeptide (TPR) repeat protein
VSAYRSGDTATAIQKFERAEAVDPDFSYPALSLGRIHASSFYTNHRGFAEAVDSFRRLDRILTENPPDVTRRELYVGYLSQGRLLLKGGRPAEAETALRRFLEAYPDYFGEGEVCNLLGVALFRRHQYDAARDAFLEAIAKAPDLVEARVNLRSVHRRLALYEETRVAHRQGALEHALGKVRRLRETAPGFLPAMVLEGDILRDLGDTDAALTMYEEVLAADHMHPLTHGVRLEMARIYDRRRETRKALDLLNQNAMRFPRVKHDPTRGEIFRLLDEIRDPP